MHNHLLISILKLCASYKLVFFFFFFNDTATTEIYTLSLHDALPILPIKRPMAPKHTMRNRSAAFGPVPMPMRSEEHTSELQSHSDLVCRLLLEKKKQKKKQNAKPRDTENNVKNDCASKTISTKSQ